MITVVFSAPTQVRAIGEGDLMTEVPMDNDLFLPRHLALGFMKRAGTTDFIVCECCHHQCSVSEMRGYCLN